MKFERGDRDVAAKRLTVNDRPARPRYLANEEIAQLERVHQKPVRAVASAVVARGGQRVAVGCHVRCERRGLMAVVAVGKDHEAAVPAGGNLDHIAPARIGTAPADGTAIAGRRCRERWIRGNNQESRRDKRKTPRRQHSDPPYRFVMCRVSSAQRSR